MNLVDLEMSKIQKERVKVLLKVSRRTPARQLMTNISTGTDTLRTEVEMCLSGLLNQIVSHRVCMVVQTNKTISEPLTQKSMTTIVTN